jgi:Ca2+-binding RTX toxin-like protein
MATIRGNGADNELGIPPSETNDTYLGLGGDDLIRADGGHDIIDGGSGFDQAWYTSSPSGITLTTDPLTGNYSVQDGFGFTDTLISIERVRGSSHNDQFFGGNGNDQFLGLGGDDVFNGGGGNDTAFYTNSPVGVNVNLGTGTALDGFGGTDTLVSVERVRGSDHNDTIIGNGSDNVILGGGGNDSLSGGDGLFDEVAYFTSAAAVSVNLQNGTASDGLGGSDSLTGFEGITGSDFGDTLTGSNVDGEFFTGGRGNDTIDGGGGGFDEIYYVDSPKGVTVNLAQGTASDGWGSTDTFLNQSIEGIEGSPFKDVLTGNASNNIIDPRGGQDRIDGGAGFDLVEFNQAIAGVFVDLARGIANAYGAYGIKLSSIEGVLGSSFGDIVLDGGGENYFDGRDGEDTARYNADRDEFEIDVVNGIVTVEGAGGVIDEYENVELLEFNDLTIATVDLLV